MNWSQSQKRTKDKQDQSFKREMWSNKTVLLNEAALY